MKIYFAHPVSDYGGSARQQEALQALGRRSGDIVNPDSPVHQAGYAMYGMTYFLKQIEECDELVYMTFSDGSIGAGVWKEIAHAHGLGKRVLRVQHGRFLSALLPMHVLTERQTGRKLKELGAR